MKKEWILNDEQLKRRKNSRLNSLKPNYQFNNSAILKSQNTTFNNNSVIDTLSNASSTLNLLSTTGTLSSNDNNLLFSTNNHNISCIPSTSTSVSLFASSRRSNELSLISPPSVQSVK